MFVSQEWLRGYRLGGGGRDGGAGVYVLSRQQLMRWHYVDGMTPTQLQEKYRLECGVYADRADLVRWMKVVPEKEECLGLVLHNMSKQFFVSRWYPAHALPLHV